MSSELSEVTQIKEFSVQDLPTLDPEQITAIAEWCNAYGVEVATRVAKFEVTDENSIAIECYGVSTFLKYDYTGNKEVCLDGSLNHEILIAQFEFDDFPWPDGDVDE